MVVSENRKTKKFNDEQKHRRNGDDSTWLKKNMQK